jgi:hypothetical protein
MKLAPVASPVHRVSYWCPDPGNAETALSGLPGAGTGRSRRNEAWLRPGTCGTFRRISPLKHLVHQLRHGSGCRGRSERPAQAPMRFRVGEEAPAGRMSSEPTHAVFAIKERQHAGSVHSRKTGVELTHRRLSAPHDGGVLGQSHAKATGGGQDSSSSSLHRRWVIEPIAIRTCSAAAQPTTRSLPTTCSPFQ